MTMKKTFWMAVCLLAVHGLMAELAVRNIKVQQRWPWNGLVDIDYEVVCSDANADIYVFFSGKDNDLNQKIKMTSMMGDGANNQPVKPGKHRATWNMTADAPNLHTTAFALHIELAQGSGIYMIIDISGGKDATSYPVTYSPTGPDLNDEKCRTTQIWLRFIPPNTSAVDGLNVDYGYYMGIFEMTQKQYSLIMGSNPSYTSFTINDGNPVNQVSYNSIRGSNEGAGYPSHNRVDASSFMGKLRAKTGLNADLPTETQWEYACRAGTTTNDTNAIGKTLNEVAWHAGNRSGNHHVVGTKAPNGWGCYDMLGNIWEWCRDRYSSSRYRALLGGSFYSSGINVKSKMNCYPDETYYSYVENSYGLFGFRLAILPPDK